MQKALHLWDDIDYMCEEKKNERGLSIPENSVDTSKQGFEDHIENNKGLITAANNITDNIKTNKTAMSRKQKLEEKQLYRYFKWQPVMIAHEKICAWLWKWHLKNETESLLIAARNNAIRTNYIKAKIDNMHQNS